MRKKNRRTKKIKLSKIYSLFFLIAIIVLAVFTSIDVCSKIVNLKCFRIARVDTDKELEEKIMSMVEDYSIFSLDIEKIREKLIDRYPELREVKISKKFPSTLKVEVIKRMPFFQIKSDKYYVVDKRLVVMERRDFPKEGLLTVEVRDIKLRLEEGTSIRDKRIIRASRLLEAIRDFPQFSPRVILANKLESISFIINDTEIILGDRDYKRKIRVLAHLLKEKFNNDLSGVKYIDLRYDKVYSGQRR
jgi:cell division septal protein FtsQ